MKVNVKYSLRNRVQRWSPGVAQPLTVSLTARSIKRIGQCRWVPTQQKIYLSRVTAYLEVSDATGHLDSPDSLVDQSRCHARLSGDFSQLLYAGFLTAVAARRGRQDSRSTSVTRSCFCSRSPPHATSRNVLRPTPWSSRDRSAELFRLGHKSRDRSATRRRPSVHNDELRPWRESCGAAREFRGVVGRCRDVVHG